MTTPVDTTAVTQDLSAEYKRNLSIWHHNLTKHKQPGGRESTNKRQEPKISSSAEKSGAPGREYRAAKRAATREQNDKQAASSSTDPGADTGDRSAQERERRPAEVRPERDTASEIDYDDTQADTDSEDDSSPGADTRPGTPTASQTDLNVPSEVDPSTEVDLQIEQLDPRATSNAPANIIPQQNDHPHERPDPSGSTTPSHGKNSTFSHIFAYTKRNVWQKPWIRSSIFIFLASILFYTLLHLSLSYSSSPKELPQTRRGLIASHALHLPFQDPLAISLTATETLPTLVNDAETQTSATKLSMASMEQDMYTLTRELPRIENRMHDAAQYVQALASTLCAKSFNLDEDEDGDGDTIDSPPSPPSVGNGAKIQKAIITSLINAINGSANAPTLALLSLDGLHQTLAVVGVAVGQEGSSPHIRKAKDCKSFTMKRHCSSRSSSSDGEPHRGKTTTTETDEEKYIDTATVAPFIHTDTTITTTHANNYDIIPCIQQQVKTIQTALQQSQAFWRDLLVAAAPAPPPYGHGHRQRVLGSDDDDGSKRDRIAIKARKVDLCAALERGGFMGVGHNDDGGEEMGNSDDAEAE